MEAVKQGEEDMPEGVQCIDHPYGNNPGGICAFCLQEKLGKLLTSSSSKFNSSSFFPAPVAPSSSSSSPSFASDGGGAAAAASSLSLAVSARPTSSRPNNSSKTKDCHHQYGSRRARIIPFLAQKKKKKKATVTDRENAGAGVLKRSKSTATPRRNAHFLDDDYSPQKKSSSGFWSFLYPSKPSKLSRTIKDCSNKSFGSKCDSAEEAESPNASSSSSFGRKVSRSRSVGCGSRSFSGDFFERISTGFGDCTLRRVESQREGKPKPAAAVRGGVAHEHHHCIKERVKCGGIFGGFILSSSSSSYWVSAPPEEMNGKSAAGVATPGALVHGRSKSWGWALASPMRAFGKPSSSGKEGKRDVVREESNKNATPNLAAIPSLLAVRG
ncbi:uncharacterized protein LOC131150771 [Malania oleifera]|uniref:uncharacterized protein LOC131150771 n=1 Tax=Malania oleifera TaxID=397392 RepID=UPI0025AE0DE2|nr:uncharacterized protein LOC131150771 [Malania oleifera]